MRHRLCGRAVFEDGTPVQGAMLAIVDEDLLFDDLIAIGLTGEDGGFRVEFTPDAFNQDPLEIEYSPDIYVVFAVRGPQGWVPVHRADFPHLPTERQGEVGAVTLPLKPGEAPRAAVGLGLKSRMFTRRARRIRLDDVVVETVLEEMAELVESLCGFSDLTRGLEVRIVDGLLLARAELLASHLGGPLPDVQHLSDDPDGPFALYEPLTRTLLIERARVEPQGLDGLRVLLGHELVHVGQFASAPSVLAEYESLVTRWWRGLAQESTDEATQMREAFGFMANLEGYAAYIEYDFLRRIYNCAEELPHATPNRRPVSRSTVLSSTVLSSTALSSTAPKPAARLQDLALLKPNQYTTGREAYRSRQQGTRPACFEPTLRPAPRQVAPVVLSVLRKRAQAGSAVHQAALGLHLVKSGEPAAVSEAEHWLRAAAAQDLGEAAHNLALLCLVPRGAYTEALHWFGMAAEQGIAAAQASLGALLSTGKGGPADMRTALSWLRGSAEAGDASGQYWLGLMYLRGEGLPQDLELARLWFERSALQGNANGQWAMGALLLEGLGCQQDLATARKWLLASAAQGDERAGPLLERIPG